MDSAAHLLRLIVIIPPLSDDTLIVFASKRLEPTVAAWLSSLHGWPSGTTLLPDTPLPLDTLWCPWCPRHRIDPGKKVPLVTEQSPATRPMQLGYASMNIQSSQKTTLPLRPLPKPKRAQIHLETMEQDTRDHQIDSRGGIEGPVGAQRALLSTTNGDVNDWIFVQRHEVPSSSVPTSSDTASIKGVGPELTATNIQLHDKLHKSSTCSSGDHRLCYRRCPKCHNDVVEKHKSPARRCSIGSGEHHLGPWAPMNAGSYESDVLCIGDWATSATGDAYTELTWDL